MDPIRRHLLFLLEGLVADRLQPLRHRWDPVMASRTPPHVSLVYPEEATEDSLLLDRAALAAADTAPFVVSLGDVEQSGRGGVWFSVLDPSNMWDQLRSRILRPPFHPIPVKPHATVVRPRTSTRGPEAFTKLTGVRIEGDVNISEMVFTETSESGMRILKRFPLTASEPVQVVAGLLRRDGRVLLCHRRSDRTHYPDVWDLPGGHIEGGETAIEAVMRELREELGIICQAAEDQPWLTLTADDLQLHIYLIDRWRGEPRNVASDEHDEVRWASADDVARLDLADPSYLEMLTRALNP